MVTFRCTKLFLYLVIHEASAILHQHPLAESMTPFSDVRPRKRISGSISELIIGLSVTQCSLKCNQNFKCLSFNFRGRSVCELNEADNFSVGILEDDINVAYFGMERDSIPACRERGIQQNIRDDSVGICLINGKRVDREWS